MNPRIDSWLASAHPVGPFHLPVPEDDSSRGYDPDVSSFFIRGSTPETGVNSSQHQPPDQRLYQPPNAWPMNVQGHQIMNLRNYEPSTEYQDNASRIAPSALSAIAPARMAAPTQSPSELAPASTDQFIQVFQLQGEVRLMSLELGVPCQDYIPDDSLQLSVRKGLLENSKILLQNFLHKKNHDISNMIMISATPPPSVTVNQIPPPPSDTVNQILQSGEPQNKNRKLCQGGPPTKKRRNILPEFRKLNLALGDKVIDLPAEWMVKYKARKQKIRVDIRTEIQIIQCNSTGDCSPQYYASWIGNFLLFCASRLPATQGCISNISLKDAFKKCHDKNTRGTTRIMGPYDDCMFTYEELLRYLGEIFSDVLTKDVINQLQSCRSEPARLRQQQAQQRRINGSHGNGSGGSEDSDQGGENAGGGGGGGEEEDGEGALLGGGGGAGRAAARPTLLEGKGMTAVALAPPRLRSGGVGEGKCAEDEDGTKQAQPPSSDVGSGGGKGGDVGGGDGGRSGAGAPNTTVGSGGGGSSGIDSGDGCGIKLATAEDAKNSDSTVLCDGAGVAGVVATAASNTGGRSGGGGGGGAGAPSTAGNPHTAAAASALRCVDMRTSRTSCKKRSRPEAASGCEDLQCFRRLVVHPQYLDAIKRGEKLVEFRSTSVPVPSLQKLRLLFCLGARWRRLGMDEMVLAEVTDTEDLSITEACRRFPREARACKLRRMAKRCRG